MAAVATGFINSVGLPPFRGAKALFNVVFRQVNEPRELFESSCVYLYMGCRTPEGEGTFAVLRSAYEDAFHRFSLQVGRWQSLAGNPAPDETAIKDSKHRVEQAQSVYRESRDVLAQFMLSRGVKGAAVETLGLAVLQRSKKAATTAWQTPLENADIGSQPGDTDRDVNRRSQVERLAYRLWEEAGRPAGRAEEHWYRAERLIHAST